MGHCEKVKQWVESLKEKDRKELWAYLKEGSWEALEKFLESIDICSKARKFYRSLKRFIVEVRSSSSLMAKLLAFGSVALSLKDLLESLVIAGLI